MEQYGLLSVYLGKKKYIYKYTPGQNSVPANHQGSIDAWQDAWRSDQLDLQLPQENWPYQRGVEDCSTRTGAVTQPGYQGRHQDQIWRYLCTSIPGSWIQITSTSPIHLEPFLNSLVKEKNCQWIKFCVPSYLGRRGIICSMTSTLIVI